MGTGRQRSLTSEMLMWIFLLVVLPLLVLSYYFYMNITSGLKEIEHEKALQTNQIAQKSIATLGESILGVTITNGYWEANRQALLTRDMEWLKTNIGDMPGVVPNVDFVAEADLTGRVLVSAGDVAQLSGTVQFPSILERFKTDKQFTGIFETSRGAAVIAVSQVTGDQGGGEAAGLLITGRLLNEESMQGLQHTLQTDVALLLRSGQFLTSNADIAEADVNTFAAAGLAGGAERFEMKRHGGVYETQTAAVFRDMSGQAIGVVYTRGESVSTSQTAAGLGRMSLYSIGIMVCLFVLVVYLLRRRILLPLRHLRLTLEQVAAGKQVDDMPPQLRQAEVEIVQALGQITQLNQALERTVEQRTAAVKNLLNNARQGFLTFRADMLVEDEYSVECVRLFGRDVAGASFPALLYPDNETERKLLEEIISEYFAQPDALKRELVFSLLPDEFAAGGFTVRAEYRPLADESGQPAALMAILSDITEQRMLESQMQRERNVLRMVVQVVTHLEEFTEMMRDFRRFHDMELVDILGSRRTLEQKMRTVYKRVHTFKGNFAFMQLMHIVPRLHEMESQLQELVDRADACTEEEFREWLRSLGLPAWADEDRKLIADVLGEQTLSSRHRGDDIALERKAWIALERRLAAALHAPEHRELLADIRQLRYTPFRFLVKSYPDFVAGAAERLGIALHPVGIEGGEIPIDAERFRDFAKSLIHVFRNIVVHGVEPADERAALGKDECGTVTFAAQRAGERLIVTIGDDGRGIDVAKLRRRAVDKGLCDIATAQSLPEADVIAFIFRDEFSTTQEVTELSGRGVGLSAVKDEVTRLGGTVDVRTALGRGTTFVFSMPMEDRDQEKEHANDES